MREEGGGGRREGRRNRKREEREVEWADERIEMKEGERRCRRGRGGQGKEAGEGVGQTL